MPCSNCYKLSDAASFGIARHMRVLARLEIAELRQEEEKLPMLQAAVTEACRARNRAIEAYKRHKETHQRNASGQAA